MILYLIHRSTRNLLSNIFKVSSLSSLFHNKSFLTNGKSLFILSYNDNTYLIYLIEFLIFSFPFSYFNFQNRINYFPPLLNFPQIQFMKSSVFIYKEVLLHIYHLSNLNFGHLERETLQFF